MDKTTHTSLPEPDPASSVPGSKVPDDAEEKVDLSHLPPEHREIVRRLRTQVQRAVTTINQLRAENKRLRQRVQELAARPDVPSDKTILALDDDPDALRDRITDFIEAIDTYLEGDNSTVPSIEESFSSDAS